MVSYKEILELESKVEDLERKLRSLEREESNYESELSGARTRSNVGLTTMPLNVTIGLTVKMLADTDISRVKSKLGEVQGNINATKSHIKSLEREIELLKKKWKEERKEAELVIDKDVIYVKGDKDKRDLLANAKKYRNDYEAKLKEIQNNPRVNAFLKAEKELKDTLENSIYEKKETYKSFKSKFADRVSLVANWVSDKGIEEISGYMIPQEGFPRHARKVIDREIDHREHLIGGINKEFESLKPTFIQRIFSSSFKKKKEEVRINNEYRINRYESEIKDLKQVLVTLDELEKDFYGRFDEIKSVVDAYKKAERALIDNEEKHLLTKKVELEDKLRKNDCIPNVSSIIPESIKNYLLETNQSVTALSLRKAISQMKELEKGVLTDLQMVLACRETHAYEPTPSRRYRY